MLVEATLQDILHVAEHMRALDRKEVFARRWSDSSVKLAHDVLNRGNLRWTATAADGEPIYVMGAYPAWPGKWELWGFGTARWPEVQLTVTKFIKRSMLPLWRQGFGHRIDCMSLAEKVEAHKWFKYLGGVEEATLPNYGRNGEDFKIFAWR